MARDPNDPGTTSGGYGGGTGSVGGGQMQGGGMQSGGMQSGGMQSGGMQGGGSMMGRRSTGFPFDETKASLKTTEFISYIALVAALFIASLASDRLDAPRVWELVTWLTIGYLLSRGLAKSGSRHWEDDGGGRGR